MMYTVTETEGHASVCVEVLNSPDDGALHSFTVVLLPEQGMFGCMCSIKTFYSCKLTYIEY